MRSMRPTKVVISGSRIVRGNHFGHPARLLLLLHSLDCKRKRGHWRRGNVERTLGCEEWKQSRILRCCKMAAAGGTCCAPLAAIFQALPQEVAVLQRHSAEPAGECKVPVEAWDALSPLLTASLTLSSSWNCASSRAGAGPKRKTVEQESYEGIKGIIPLSPPKPPDPMLSQNNRFRVQFYALWPGSKPHKARGWDCFCILCHSLRAQS